MDDIELIEKLSLARGISGFEDEVLEVARAYLKDFCMFEEDSMRNLYIYPKYNKGNRAQVLLDAHSDEVGFMVRAIKPDGTLKFITVGGWNDGILPSGKVQVYTKTGYISGVISATPPHLQSAEQRNAPVTCDSLVIDIGAANAEDAKKMGVQVGAPAVPLTPFEYGKESGIMHGKAFDDRLGVFALLKTLKLLKDEKLSVDVVGIITSQEEVGARGITAAMYKLKPAAAICLEGCPADDTISPEYMVQDALRGGVMLRHIDRTVICTPRFLNLAQTVAQNSGIKVQMAVRSTGGNNGAYIISANGGTPVIVAGIPVRYIHSFSGIAVKEDVDGVASLCAAICKTLTEKIIKSF